MLPSAPVQIIAVDQHGPGPQDTVKDTLLLKSFRPNNLHKIRNDHDIYTHAST